MVFPTERVLPNDDRLPAHPAAGQRPVRLNRDRTISPTLLKTYRECPHRVRLQYIDQVVPPRQYEHHLSQGRIAHDLLAMAANRVQHGMAVPDRAEIRNLAYRRVPRNVFPTPEAHADAVHEIVRWVETGMRHLRRDPDSTILLVERPQKRAFGPDDPLQLTFRPDLVRWTADADGAFLEVIDYKTGKRWPDEHVPVVARFVINAWLEREGQRAWTVPARFTWVWLELGERDSVDLDPESCSASWRAVTSLVDRLFAETEWLPVPSMRCRWCPFHRVACHAADTASPGLQFEGPGD
ncbi:MAG: PD-(D/E)XK nuclease family protein [Thermomicrobiales bacterium]